MTADGALTLEIRKVVNAAPERVFAAWTEPRRVIQWWGPAHVVCTDASADLKIGGRYRIANKLPDGSIVWISGEYEEIAPPRRLVFSWVVEGMSNTPERVTVEFLERDEGRATEVVVSHERIPDRKTRDLHQTGWLGCMDGLANYLS